MTRPASPSDVRFKPQGPVDWALGKVFLEAAGKPLLHMLLPDRVDPRDWMTAERFVPNPSALPMESGVTYQDYWFDFIADTGDSDVAAYAIAYLFHGDLVVADPARLLKTDEPVLDAPLPVVTSRDHGTQVLPRGQLLYVGGDTAYPVADFASIKARFTAPLNFAYEQRFANEPEPPVRPLFGIPGNHDWYDNLDGFNHTFRRTTPANGSEASSTPPSPPRGHEPAQQASYTAIGLGDGWELWAFDARDVPVGAEASGGVHVDHRQRRFFETQSIENPPRRLVIATPKPVYVDGYKANWVDKFFENLPESVRQKAVLWFSGDAHHYARYACAELGDNVRITSLVSGLGGAALHSPLGGEHEPAKVHPAIADGGRAVVRRLTSPRYMLKRSGLRWAGAVIGMILGAGAAQSSGEIGPHVAQLFSSHDAPQPSPPWVLVLLVATVISLVVMFKRPMAEREARAIPIAERLLSAVRRLLLLPLALLIIAHFDQRALGNVLLDFAFEVTAGVLSFGVGALLIGGLGRRSSMTRSFGLGVLTLCLSVILVGGSCAVGNGVDALLRRHEPALVSLSPVLSGLAAGGLLWLLFPILAGFALALAFGTGTQRAFISSFAAVDTFQSFIRFRLRVRGQNDSALTGFVVSVTHAPTLEQLKSAHKTEDLVPRAEVIDVFTVR